MNFFISYMPLMLQYSIFFCMWKIMITQNNVSAMLFLMLSFLFTTVLLICLNCEFLGLIFSLIYMGAIAVLFLFILMMLDIKLNNLFLNKYSLFMQMFIFVSLLFFLFFFITRDLHFTKNFFWRQQLEMLPSVIFLFKFLMMKNKILMDLFESVTIVQIYGQMFYLFFVFHFLISGILLMVGLISICYLTVEIISNFKMISFLQISRKK